MFGEVQQTKKTKTKKTISSIEHEPAKKINQIKRDSWIGMHDTVYRLFDNIRYFYLFIGTPQYWIYIHCKKWYFKITDY